MKSFYFCLTLFCCILLSACGSGKTADAGSSLQHDHKPSMDVKVDLKGTTAIITVTTDLQISAEHYGQARKDGEGHIHMYLDGGEKVGVKSDTHEFKDLKPGKHSLKVSLHNNDHTPYDVTKIVDFTI